MICNNRLELAMSPSEGLWKPQYGRRTERKLSVDNMAPYIIQLDYASMNADKVRILMKT
jgi:hypothetical protein